MLPSNVRKRSPDRGYTLAELLTVLVLIGIGAALTAPNLIFWSHRQKMSSAVEIVQGALEDAQRQAIRLGKKCTVQLDGSMNDGVTSYNRLKAKETGQGQCLVAAADIRSLELPQEIRMVTNIASNSGSPQITFSFLGHVSSPKSEDLFQKVKDFPMIVVYSTLDKPSLSDTSQNPKQQRRCVVIVSMLGAIQTGIYEGSMTDLDATRCRAHVNGVR